MTNVISIPGTGETRLPPQSFLTLNQWRTRDLPDLDCLLGELFHTTTRILLAAATGLGKTNFSIALGMRMAAGLPFLHWAAGRPAKVLYIDGEMSRRLLKRRLMDEEARLLREVHPDERDTARELLAGNFHALSTEDVENFQPLNTPAGQAMIDSLIKNIGGCDLAIFDNSMSLIAGSMKEEDSWAQVQPWANSLSKRSVGQLWVHHTNDQDKIYGTKTRGWQMGAVILLTKAERDDTDVSFTLKFDKARERTPDNRDDFREVNICLLNDEWQSSGPTKDCAPGLRVLIDAVNEALGDDGIAHRIENGPSVRAVNVKTAKKVHERRYPHNGDGDRKEAERKAWKRNFNKAVETKKIGVDGELVWIV